MSKYILIDLEDTITIHNYKNRLKNIMIEWLKYNKVSNPEEVYNDCRFKERNSRLSLLGIDDTEYKKWYTNFSEVEFLEYKKRYLNKQIIIFDDTISFIKECRIPLILVSNSSPKWINYILEEYNLISYFKYIFLRDYSVDDIKKPNPQVINIIEKSINDKVSQNSIFIGDSYSDYLFAKNCNLDFICVYNKIKTCLYFDSFKELCNYINSFK